MYTSPYNPNSPRAEQPIVASSRDRFLREIIHEEPNNNLHIYLVHFAIPKHTKSLQIRNHRGRYTTAIEGGWYKYSVYTSVSTTYQAS